MGFKLIFSAVFLMLLSCQKGETKTQKTKEVTIFAAASTGPALQEIAVYLKNHEQIRLRIHVAASSILAQQIRYGAPCDLVLLADPVWMKELSDQKKIIPNSEIILLSNRLVIISPLRETFQLHAENLNTLPHKFQGRFVVGDPEHVPVGRYAKAALSAMKVWQPLISRFLYASDARAALLWVEQGEAGAGMIYRSDAITSKKVHIATLVPEALHPPIHYPMAMCKSSERNEVKYVRDFLTKAPGQNIFKRHGFQPSAVSKIEKIPPPS